MARNSIKSAFRSSNMAAGGHFVKKSKALVNTPVLDKYRREYQFMGQKYASLADIIE